MPARSWWLAALALAALAGLAYSNAFGGGFVLDSRVIILEDPRLRALSAGNLREILEHTYWWPYAELGLYRPLTTFTYLVNYSVLGNAAQPFGYHAVNVALHAANAILLAMLVARLSGRFKVGMFAAAVWVVHPLHTEAVTNIVGRADLLAAFGTLLALFAHLKAADEDHARRWRAIEAAGAAIAVFSKESGLAVVGIVLLFDLLWRNRRSWRDIGAGLLPVVIPAVIFLVQRQRVLAAAGPATPFPFLDNPIGGAPFWSGRLTAVAVAGRLLSLVLWPFALSADYSFAEIPLASGAPADWIGWLIVLAFVAIAAVLFIVRREAFFACAAAAIAYLPVANLLFPTGTIMAERLMYLPSAFLVPVVVASLFVVERIATAGVLVAGTLTTVVLLFALRTQIRNADWTDDLTLWRATARTSPRSFKAHTGLADALYESDPTRGNLPQVIAEQERGLAILDTAPRPQEASLQFLRAAVYYAEWAERVATNGQPTSDADSRAAYAKAAERAERFVALSTLSPVSEEDQRRARLLLSTVYSHLSRTTEALATARASRDADPLNPIAYRTLAAALVAERKPDEAGVELMTGFMMTGDQTLRTLLADLYRGGLDAQGCAVTTNGTRIILNSSCAIVSRHMCAAAAETARLQRARGRNDLAESALAAVAQLPCAAPANVPR